MDYTKIVDLGLNLQPIFFSLKRIGYSLPRQEATREEVAAELRKVAASLEGKAAEARALASELENE